MSLDIVYALEPQLTAAEFVDVLRRTSLGERRPLDDLLRMEAMLRNADIIMTARCDGLLVGVARAVSDFSFCTYLSDLAVDENFQRRGIGRELIRRTQEAAGMNAKVILIAAPKAVDYYPHIGMTRHDSCWLWP